MRILRHRIFKFFGGKIKDFQTNVNNLPFLKNKIIGACVFEAPVFF